MHPTLTVRLRRRAVAAASLALLVPAAMAQVSTVVITGNPLRGEVGPPASVLSGDALARARAGTLGDTLSGLPGVAGSGFGPQSSRPVIRGLDGDRIRLLDNGGASVDASSLSFDHAAAVEPLVVERFEVLRGPAALLYGGNATGGVVNAIDNRIPRDALGRLGGRAEVRLGGAASERAGAAVVEGGAGGINWHADVAARKSNDLRVPGGRVVNSAGDSRAGALGVSWVDADGHVGAAIDGYRNDYGVVVEPDVTIAMRRDRIKLAADRRLGGPLVERVEFQASGTRYRHQELEGDEVGTTFSSRGEEVRLHAQHATLTVGAGTLHGLVGVQAERLDFSALGEEAFVPDTRTRSQALFVLEEWRLPAFSLTAGARIERVRVVSAGDAPGSTEPRFGAPSERAFSPTSASFGLRWPFAAQLTLSAHFGATERAPTYYELYANGVHVATGAFEVGDPTLRTERSTHAELGLHWRGAHSLVKAQVFATRFARYIALDATGRDVDVVDEDGAIESFPELAFRAVPARLAGFELEGRTRLVDAPWAVDLTGVLDAVRASNRASSEPLPRVPPWRLRLGLEASQGAWSAGFAVRHQARQGRVPATDVPTPGATLIDASMSWRQRWSAADTLVFVRLENLGDRLAYNAAALRVARELSPLPGRAATLGLRVNW